MRGFDQRLERLELKYLIDERTAARVRRDIEPWCEPDPHNLDGLRAGPTPGRGYWIHSLYLDSPSLAFHRAKERGDPERRKLRLRGYAATHTRVDRAADARGCPWVELKERSRDVIAKTRAPIRGERLEDVTRGFAKLRDETAAGRRFLDRFARHASASGAEPTLLVRYRREAWASPTGEYTRVTFDRDVAFQRHAEWSLDGDPQGWSELDHHTLPGTPDPLVVLELKCETTVPHWITALVRNHDLRRRSFSKYSIGVHLTDWLAGAPLGGRSLRGVLA